MFEMNSTTLSFLNDPQLQLLLFGGKGGVGKTTCATATALRLARDFPVGKFLLVSTDPAHSLSDCLASYVPPANLQVLEFNAQACLETFKRKHQAQFQEIAERGTFLDQDDIHQFLNLSLPGLDELMAFLEIARWVEEQSYQAIVVDTAPTGHTIRLLAMPALIRQWLQALEALLAKHRYLRQLFQGADHADELDRFLEGLAASVARTESLLQNAGRCRFVPVMLAEPMVISETRALLRELKQGRVPVAEILINRLYPVNECPRCAEAREGQQRQLEKIGRDPAFRAHRLWGIPLYPQEVCGRVALASFWEGATLLSPAPVAPSARLPVAGPLVEAPVRPPEPGQRLLLFAGKGGVGKTTMACATALHLAADCSGGGVLLLSLDPAHSLSDCLAQSVGPRPTDVAAGLSAMEVDAQAEFHALKQLYREELQTFLQSLLPEMDLAYDRQAMEKLLDLSPPGLDEVIALTQVMEVIEQGRYETLVLDAAPTGHLIRFLETPEIIDQWLKVFFGLFLKYKRIFRLPKVTHRLVEISRNLKRWRRLLNDPTQCAVYGVAILTEMACQETKDLYAATLGLGLNMAALFLNLATPPGTCPLCRALSGRESKLKGQFRKSFPGVPQVLVYRQSELRGLSQLRQLARALYAWPPILAEPYTAHAQRVALAAPLAAAAANQTSPYGYSVLSC